MAGAHGIERVARVGVQPEVVVAAPLRAVASRHPLLMMAEQQRAPGGRKLIVEPLDLRRPHRPGRPERDRGVEQRDRQTGQIDPLVAGVGGLAVMGVVVAAHDVQALAERCAVARFERRPLAVLAVVRQVTLHDHGRGIDAGDLGHGAAVHHLRVRRLTRLAVAGSARSGGRRSARTRSRRSGRR